MIINIQTRDYNGIEFVAETGLKYIGLYRYEHDHIWTLKAIGFRAMVDAFNSDEKGQLLMLTHRDLLQGDLKQKINTLINHQFDQVLIA